MSDQRSPHGESIWEAETAGPRPVASRPPPLPRAKSRAKRRRRSAWPAIAGYAALAVVCLCVGAVAFLVVAAPVEFLRDRLVSEVKARTGRDLAVAGPASLSLFPSVTVSLADVSLAAPPSMPGEPTLVVPVVEAEVGYWSLVTGRPTAQRITLHRPVIALDVDAEGRRSWDLRRTEAGLEATGKPASSASRVGDARPQRTPAALAAFERIAIVDGTLRYRNARSGASYDIGGLSLTLTADGAGSTLALEGRADWKGDRVGLSGKLAPLPAVLAGQPAEAAFRIAGQHFAMTYEGRVGTSGGALLDGNIGFTAPSAAALRAWLGRASSGAADPGQVAASARLVLDGAQANLTGLEATVGAVSIRGDVGVETRERRPFLKGSVAVSDLDLDALLVRPRRRAAIPERPQAPDVAPAGRRQRGTRGWREDPIDLSLLRGADAELALAVQRLSYDEIKAGPGTLALGLKDGVASLQIETLELYGGRAGGSVTLDGSGEVPVAGAKLKLAGVAMPPLTNDTLGFEWLDGRGTVVLEVAGQGKSEREIVEALNGKLEVAVADGAMLGADAGKIIGNLQRGRLASLAPAPGDRTPFSELAGSFEIVNGIAKSRDLRLVSAHVKLDGEGTFVLGERRMDCELRAKVSGVKQQDGAASINVGSLEVPITISGPWERPVYGIKGQERLLESVKQIGRRLKSRDVEDTIKGLLGDDKEERAKSRQKARELLENFLKKE